MYSDAPLSCHPRALGVDWVAHSSTRNTSLCSRYKEEESRTASRAGHSAMLLRDAGGYQLVVFGGRDSSDCEMAGRWGKGKIHVSV